MEGSHRLFSSRISGTVEVFEMNLYDIIVMILIAILSIRELKIVLNECTLSLKSSIEENTQMQDKILTALQANGPARLESN